MPHQPPDRTLRRLTARLARLREADLAAILQILGAADRAQIMALMEEYKAVAMPVPSAPRLGYDITRLSPWLAQRLESAVSGAMTAHAEQTLIACAAKLYPLTVSEPENEAQPRRHSLVRTLFGSQGQAG